MMISVCILTKNAEKTLEATLDSLIAFPEVLLLDNGSSDKTLSLAELYPNVRVYKEPFIGFGPLRNRAAELAQNDWILAIDSDEILSLAALEEIRKLSLDPHFAYSFPRHNFYRGKRIRGCGWDPERVTRLYHRNWARFADVQVHEAVVAPRIQKLTSPLLHTPYRSIADFLTKMEHYSALFALEKRGKKKSSLAKAIGKGVFHFFKSYFLQRGFLDGPEGFIISLYNGNTAFYKYLKLAEANKN